MALVVPPESGTRTSVVEAGTNTPLLAGPHSVRTPGSTVEKGKLSVSKQYDTYESKHGHVDTIKEKHQIDEVLHGVEDGALKYLILFFDKFSRIIIGVFSMMLLLTAGAIAVGWLGLWGGRFVWFIVILSLTGFGALLGAYGVYKYGALQEYVNKFDRENKEYETEMYELEDTNKSLKKNVRGISKSVVMLEKNVDELEDTLGKYDEVLKDLWGLAGDHGEMQQIMDMIDSLMSVNESMKNIAIRSQKAVLLSNFYSAQAKDGVPGLSKREYGRFLASLPKKSRIKFKQKGTFETLARNDGAICLEDFQDVVDEIVAECDEEMVTYAKKVKSTRNITSNMTST